MKKLMMSLMIALFVVFGFSSGAGAYQYENSGEHMFTLEGNDSNFEGLEEEIEAWFLLKKGIERIIDLTLYSKYDVDEAEYEGEGMMIVTFAGDGSGTWSTDEAIEFYTVKGGDEFAVYWEDGGSKSGSWNIGDLVNPGDQTPDISHLSTWNTLGDPGDPGAPVPEPSTVILLGCGLLGLAALKRKRK